MKVKLIETQNKDFFIAEILSHLRDNWNIKWESFNVTHSNGIIIYYILVEKLN